jgi:hypothetical protein
MYPPSVKSSVVLPAPPAMPAISGREDSSSQASPDGTRMGKKPAAVMTEPLVHSPTFFHLQPTPVSHTRPFLLPPLSRRGEAKNSNTT